LILSDAFYKRHYRKSFYACSGAMSRGNFAVIVKLADVSQGQSARPEVGGKRNPCPKNWLRVYGIGAISTADNHSPTQKAEQRKRMKIIALALKEENKRNTQAKIAGLLGIARTTVGRWPPQMFLLVFVQYFASARIESW